MDVNDKFHFENLMFCDEVTLSDYEEHFEKTQDLDYLYYKCQHLIDLDEIEKASDLLERIKEVDSDAENSSRYLACMLKLEFYQGNLFNCKSIWTNVVKDDNFFSDKWLHYEYVVFLYHFESPYLENVLDDLLSKHPDFLPAILMKSDILVGKNSNREALECFRPYLARKPQCISVEACNSIASIHLALNESGAAKSWIDRGLSTVEHSDTYLLEGLYLEQIFSNPDEIINAYRRAFALDNNNLDAFLNLSSSLNQFSGEEELKFLLESIEITELDQRSLSIGVLASYLLFLNKQQAISYLELISDIFPREDVNLLSDFISNYEIESQIQISRSENVNTLMKECLLALRND